MNLISVFPFLMAEIKKMADHADEHWLRNRVVVEAALEEMERCVVAARSALDASDGYPGWESKAGDS